MRYTIRVRRLGDDATATYHGKFPNWLAAYRMLERIKSGDLLGKSDIADPVALPAGETALALSPEWAAV